MRTVSEKPKFHKPIPVTYVHTHTRTHANIQALWVQKEDYLALFSQLMNRLSRNVGKDCVIAQDSAVFVKDLSEKL